MQKGARLLRFTARLRPFRDQVGVQLFLVLAAGLLVGPWSGRTALAASPFYVNSMTDATDANIGDGVCASAAGACTLRAAIQETNAAADCSTNPQQTMQTINVQPGTYTLIAGEGEDNGATGDLDIKTHVTINGAGAQATIVDASQNDRVLDVFSRCTVRIVGISATNGRITQGGSVGAGIQNRGQLTLDSVSVTNNVAGTNFSLSGGGIYNHQRADLTLLQVVVSGNKATNLSAGIENGGSLKVYNSTIADNQTIVLGGRGSAGGIQNTSGGTAQLIGSTVSGNGAWRGGGIYLDLAIHDDQACAGLRLR
jgi:CSLREA domain-containing protein